MSNRSKKIIGSLRTFLGFLLSPGISVTIYVFASGQGNMAKAGLIVFGTLYGTMVSVSLGAFAYSVLIKTDRLSLPIICLTASILAVSFWIPVALVFFDHFGIKLTLVWAKVGAISGIVFWFIALWKNPDYFVPSYLMTPEFKRPKPRIAL